MTDTIHSSDDKSGVKEVIEITTAMIEAGEEVIYSELVGAPDLPPFFKSSVFAEKVFRAMWDARSDVLDQ
jgi:hypothetical protein